jgi:hypothetical protein
MLDAQTMPMTTDETGSLLGLAEHLIHHFQLTTSSRAEIGMEDGNGY